MKNTAEAISLSFLWFLFFLCIYSSIPPLWTHTSNCELRCILSALPSVLWRKRHRKIIHWTNTKSCTVRFPSKFVDILQPFSCFFLCFQIIEMGQICQVFVHVHERNDYGCQVTCRHHWQLQFWNSVILY
jgi:hypothetical protein